MININTYWNASPLRPKSGSIIAPVCVSLPAVYSLLRPNHCVNEDTCKDVDSGTYKCVYITVHTETVQAYSSAACVSTA